MTKMTKPLISLCMIVKNEEANLQRCLDSVKGVVDEMIIVDTGSTDRTKEIAMSYGAKVYDFEWIDDFSAARNFSLEKATGEWILVLDADEELETESKKKLRDTLLKTKADAFMFRSRNFFVGRFQNVVDVLKVYLFRNNPKYRYQRKYHEEIYKCLKKYRAKISRPNDFLVLHYGYLSRDAQGTNRSLRAVRHMEKELQEDPRSSLAVKFGVELYRAGEYDRAYEFLVGIIKNTPTERRKIDFSGSDFQIALVCLADLALKRGEYNLARRCGEAGMIIQWNDLDIDFFTKCAYAFGIVGEAHEVLANHSNKQKIKEIKQLLKKAENLLQNLVSLPYIREKNRQLVTQYLSECIRLEQIISE